MRGFTLIELLVTIGLIIAVSTISFIYIFGHKQARDLQFTVQEITTVLRTARNNSVSQEGGSRWGVHFKNTSSGSFFSLFQGASYSVSTTTATTSLRSTVQFIDPSADNGLTVIFSPITGLPDAPAAVKISLVSNSQTSSTININSNGEIQY